MNKTIAELRLLIDDMEANYVNNLRKLGYGATTTKIIELSGQEVVMSNPFSFEKELSALDKECTDISYLKGMLAKANNDTQIDDIDTIQTAIVKLQKKRELLKKVDNILENTMESKRRKSDGGMSNSNAYYEEVSLNYDESELNDYKNRLRTELNALEVKIQNANNSTNITIEH